MPYGWTGFRILLVRCFLALLGRVGARSWLISVRRGRRFCTSRGVGSFDRIFPTQDDPRNRQMILLETRHFHELAGRADSFRTAVAQRDSQLVGACLLK